jgi:hypothetical protein
MPSPASWFHVCLSMFRPQPLFDTLLRPAVENPQVTSIQFILDARRPLLHAHQVQPPLMRVVIAGGLFWLAILLVLTLSDFMSRGWLPVFTRFEP